MPNELEARFRRQHADSPVILTSAEDVDALIDSLLVSPPHQNLAQLHSLQRPALPSGFPDHELLVGASGSQMVGVLAFMEAQGNVVSLNSSEGRGEVAYSIMGQATEFPDRSEISVALVRQAVKEFLVNGGQRPTCVQWQTPEYW